MGVLFLSTVSVILFCLCTYGLLSVMQKGWQPMAFQGEGYSKRALRIEYYYKVTALGLLDLFLFVSMLGSFIETFRTL